MINDVMMNYMMILREVNHDKAVGLPVSNASDELDEEDDQNKSDWMKGETEQYLDRRTAITICSVSYVYCVNDR